MMMMIIIIVQLILAIDTAVRFLHCCLYAAMSFSVVRCLPAVFFHFVTPARRRSSLIQSLPLLFSRPLDLFPVGFHWCTLLVSLLSFICDTCSSHFYHICLIPLDIGTCVESSVWPFRLWSCLYTKANPHNSSEPAIFTGIKPILLVFGDAHFRMWILGHHIAVK